MKIQLASDLHLEFCETVITNKDNADVLILAGDICVADDFKDQPQSIAWEVINNEGYGRAKRTHRYRKFFKGVCSEFKHVIYVMGNHEHYHGKFDLSADILRKEFESQNLTNIHLLDNDCIKIDDVYFLGATLWTSMNNYDPLTMYHVEQMMNDFRIIRIAKENFKKFLPQRVVLEHKDTLTYFKNTLDTLSTDAKVVVVGHHAPSELSIDDRYKEEHLMNGAYFSNLENFILDNPKIKAWVHGHVHQTFSYEIGTTKIMCNPKGYNDENPSYNENFTFEI